VVLADIWSREDSTRIEAAVTRRRMALVCAVAGLTMVGGFLVANAIEEANNCKPEPYFEWCQAPGIVNLFILNGPWLVATYLLARRQAIVLFACLLMGWMWWLGFLAYVVLFYGPGDDLFELVAFTVLGGAIAMLVIGLLTAVVGSAMQVVIRRRRRKRLPHPA
jgi:hypothetical protein